MKCTILSSGFEKSLKVKNEEESSVALIKAFIREEIWKLYKSGYSDFYVSCEYGVPLWSAEIICALKLCNSRIRLHIAVPYEEQALSWHEDVRDRYYNVHSKADSVEFVSVREYDGCLKDTEKYMTAKSNALLILCGRDSEKGIPELGSIRICRSNVLSE